MPRDVTSLLSRINQTHIPYRVFESETSDLDDLPDTVVRLTPVEIDEAHPINPQALAAEDETANELAAPEARGVAATALGAVFHQAAGGGAPEGAARGTLFRRYSTPGPERSDRLKDLFQRYSQA